MILDTSALLALLLREPESDEFARLIEEAPVTRLSAATYLEAAMFVESRGDPVCRAMLDSFLVEFDVRVEPVTFEQARQAREAFRMFGKGMHPARLNFGDCFSYALAKAFREDLLFKGSDFSQTDLRPATA